VQPADDDDQPLTSPVRQTIRQTGRIVDISRLVKIRANRIGAGRTETVRDWGFDDGNRRR
jgi:hypothetical protein